MLTIYGVPFSAHTRKVIVSAIEKGIPYEMQSVVPLTPPAGWSQLSPLGHIPAIRLDDFTLADSSVICLYLERLYPRPSLYPEGARDYARALWIEEFVDGGLQQHVLKGLLRQRVFAPKFLGLPADEALIKTSLTEMIPPRLAYLENSLTGTYFAGERFSVADITVASILLNYHYAGEALDPRVYPRLHGYLRRILLRDSFKGALRKEIPAAASIGALKLDLLHDLGY